MNEQVQTVQGAPLFNPLSPKFAFNLFRCLSLAARADNNGPHGVAEALPFMDDGARADRRQLSSLRDISVRVSQHRCSPTSPPRRLIAASAASVRTVQPGFQLGRDTTASSTAISTRGLITI